MDFSSFIESKATLLTEGSIYERLRRFPSLTLDPHIANASLIYQPESAAVLRSIVEEYLEVGARYSLPMFTLTNTWRANKERIGNSDYRRENVNFDCVQFYRGIVTQFGGGTPVYLGGLMGCRGDAYKSEESLSEADAYDFHKWQADALAIAGVDFLFASTLPAVEEAKGLARAMAETELPYIISFVIRSNGQLLDGVSFQEAVRQVDRASARPPLRYMVNCSHSSAFRAAFPYFEGVADRVAGLQANTSARDPLELDGAPELETEDPSSFGKAMRQLKEDFHSQILGGCCGTSTSHIEAIARELSESTAR
ncbi:MAG: hypothetical protein RL518_2659 [Pseudomonadota bacterium]|jgi:homocysteine S-methyltransferase